MHVCLLFGEVRSCSSDHFRRDSLKLWLELQSVDWGELLILKCELERPLGPCVLLRISKISPQDRLILEDRRGQERVAHQRR
jgi:hypothetical protein